MLRIYVKLCQKSNCCFYVKNHNCVSELVNASDVPDICVAQLEIEFAAPSEKYFVMVSYVTKAVILQYSMLLASLAWRRVISAEVASQHGRNLQFVFCWSDESPATHATVPCIFKYTELKSPNFYKITKLLWKQSLMYRSNVFKFLETEKLSQIFSTVSQNTAETRFTTMTPPKYTKSLLYDQVGIRWISCGLSKYLIGHHGQT